MELGRTQNNLNHNTARMQLSLYLNSKYCVQQSTICPVHRLLHTLTSWIGPVFSVLFYLWHLHFDNPKEPYWIRPHYLFHIDGNFQIFGNSICHQVFPDYLYCPKILLSNVWITCVKSMVLILCTLYINYFAVYNDVTCLNQDNNIIDMRPNQDNEHNNL